MRQSALPSGLSYSVDAKGFGQALSGIARETGKSVRDALRAESRRLAIELAGLALPNAGALWGKNGLKSKARKTMEKRIFKDLHKIHRSAGSLSLREASYLDNPIILNILARDFLGKWRREATKQTKLSNFFGGTKTPTSLADVERQAIEALSDGGKVRSTRIKTKSGEYREENFGSVIFRIMRAALVDPAKALYNLKRFIKPDGESSIQSRSSGGGTTFAGVAGGRVRPSSLRVVRGVGGTPYREELDSYSRKQGFRQLIVLEGRKDTRSLINSVGKSLISRIGKVKGGWIDAGFRIPKPGGTSEPQIDSWISGKKGNGRSTEWNASSPMNLDFAITLQNSIGNAGNIDSRLRYTDRAIKNRTRAMRKVIEAVMKKRLGSKTGASQFEAIYGRDG
jgi:hypothetical protein